MENVQAADLCPVAAIIVVSLMVVTTVNKDTILIKEVVSLVAL